MGKKNLVIKQNQVTLSHLKSQEDTQDQWSKQNKTLKRFKVQLPDLTDSFAPDWHELPRVLKQLQEFDEHRGGLSTNTLKMLSFVLRKWDYYCKTEAIYSFPINKHILLNWFRALKIEGVKINTLRQYRAQLSLFHKIMEIEDITKNLSVKTFFTSLPKDEMEITGEQLIDLQAKPFKKIHLNKLMDTWGNHKYPMRFRDLTVLTVAYGTLLRESEIGSIRKKHITILDNWDVNIERVSSKTSISPEPKRLTGRFASILRTYLTEYCDNLEDNEYIFSWLTSKGLRPAAYRETPMSGMTVDRIYQRAHRCLEKSGDVVTSKRHHRDIWSGHSSRVGALQDGYAAGLSLPQLIQLGDWKSDSMVLRYLRGLDNDNSPNLLLQS